jgi:hypothetical protein
LPYVNEERKKALAEGTVSPQELEPGDLNYLITELLVLYLATHEKNYTTLNAIVGALDSAKLEFYRRIVAPYEMIKMQENGDVYDRLFKKPSPIVMPEAK